jgi:transposase
MPELKTLSREKVAALAGLAPFDDDSGKRKGSRHIAGGRDRVRKSLYAAAMPAAFQWNPALAALYGRLKIAGKPQACPCRLREKAPHLRQHRADQRNTMDHQTPAKITSN